MWGDAKWHQRQKEEEDRRAEIDAEQWERGSKLEALLRTAETDIDAGRLVELARLLFPQDFKMREEGLERVRNMRMEPRGNDPAFQDIIRTHERVARLSIEFAISKARAVMTLVESWKK